FAREVVKKGSFADIGCFGDVLDRGFRVAFRGKQGERGAEQAFAKFGTAAFATGANRSGVRRGSSGGAFHDQCPYMTIGHFSANGKKKASSNENCGRRFARLELARVTSANLGRTGFSATFCSNKRPPPARPGDPARRP